MKNKKALLATSLAALTILGGCGPTSQVTDQSVPSISNPTSIDEGIVDGITLDFFMLIKDTTNNEINEAISYFSSVVEKEYGSPFVLMNKDQHQERYDFEIVVGNIYENETTNYYKSLNVGDFIIKTKVSENKVTYYVGGYSDYETSVAVYEFADAFKKGEIFKDDGNLNLLYDGSKNINEIYFTNAEIKEFGFVINKNLKQKVVDTANLFIEDFNKYYHVNKTLIVDGLGSATCENYNSSSFVIGLVNQESFDIASTFGDNQYDIRVVRHGENFNIYIHGVSDQQIIHSIQTFYREVVKNGNMNIRKYYSYNAQTISRRDPCIVPYNGVYYLYTSHGSGYQVETSTDLKYWSQPKTIFDASWDPEFTGNGDYWAPECHFYNGKFYLIATYKSSTNNHRGCGVWVSDTPDGEFKLISNNHITPSDWDAIDGTLYVDKEGQPYMVFVHEWTSLSNGIGRMCYAKLSDDLTHFIETPVEIFAANDPVWTDQCVTDGCYMYRTEDDELLMIWSNFANEGFSNYTIGIAKSDNGEIDGNWIQLEKVLHTNDNKSVYSVFNGGHGMIFETFEGETYITFHAPNNAGEWMTLLMFLPIIEKNGTIELDLVN